MSNERKPWERRKGEHARAYQVFQEFLNLGPHRKLVDIHDRVGMSRNMISKWSSLWDWFERAGAWDTHISEIQQEQFERVARDTAEMWARRKIEAAEAKWAKAKIVMEWADLASEQAPLFEETVDHTQVIETYDATGKRITVNVPLAITMKPAKWNRSTVLEAYKTAVALQSAAIQEATQHSAEDDGFDPMAATPDELRAWLVKKGMKALPG